MIDAAGRHGDLEFANGVSLSFDGEVASGGALGRDQIEGSGAALDGDGRRRAQVGGDAEAPGDVVRSPCGKQRHLAVRATEIRDGVHLWRLGRWWGDAVARKWEAAVRASLQAVKLEAERRAGRR